MTAETSDEHGHTIPNPPASDRSSKTRTDQVQDLLSLVQPLDEHNREMLALTHPADWQNPEPKAKYHLLVVGGGPAGLVAAVGAAGLGAKVALVEKHLIGGDCLVSGCVPSKALLRSAKAAAEVRSSSRFGVSISGDVAVDFPGLMRRMRSLRARISHHDAAARFREMGIDIFLGNGKFTGPDAFQIDGKILLFAKACIATGTRAAVPPIPGLDDIPYLTNETLFSLTSLPRRLGIIGAGPIGCEMAQAFSRFGGEVHLIEALHGVLPREDPDASAIVKAAMERDGVRVRCCGRQLKVENAAEGIRLVFESHDKGYDFVVDQLLVSTGRVPNVEGLELFNAGVSYSKQGIVVNDHLRTSNRRIFAAGDVCSTYKFTHAADAMARLVLQNALFFGRARASAMTIPWCTYTDPELAHVGLTEAAANERGLAFQTFRVELKDVDRAVLDGEEDGFVKVHTEKRSDKILGATIIARHAGDLIGEISLAMTAGLGLKAIARTIHPYPTQGEALKKAADAYARTRLTPFAKKILGVLLRLKA